MNSCLSPKISRPIMNFLSTSLNRKFWSHPSFQGFLIQGFVFTLNVIIIFNLPLFTNLSRDTLVIQFFAVQAVFSAAIAMYFQPKWWIVIHFIFPLCVLTFTIFQLPSFIYFLCLVLTVGVYWTTFKSRVPYYPSFSDVWLKAIDLIPNDQPFRVLEIGSGLGGFSFKVAKLRPLIDVTGIEIAPIPWAISKLISYLKPTSARLTLGNYDNLNFAHYDLIYAYLSPEAMPQLWKKACKEMRSNSFLFSHEFLVPNVKADSIINYAKNKTSSYVYIIHN